MDTSRSLVSATPAVESAAVALAARIGRFPVVAIVAGSGLGAIARQLDRPVSIGYEEIPGFPASSVAGHAGRLVVGRLADRPAAVFSGRKHLYEGASLADATFAVRLAAGLGTKTLILSNAAGGVSPLVQPGDLMLIADHVNVANRRVLRFVRSDWRDGPDGQHGPDGRRGAAGLPGLAEASGCCYSPRLMALARAAALRAGIPLREGVYCVNLGPSFETPAEARLARLAGADAVGMSTAPEAIAAAACGLETLAISCITNTHLRGPTGAAAPATHGEVLQMAARAGRRFVKLVKAIVAALPEAGAACL